VIVLLWACSASLPPARPGEPTKPTEPSEPSEPSEPTEPTEPEPDGLELSLVDGTVLRGSLVASYDQRIWWASAEVETLALFDPAGWASWPEDRSLRFVHSTDIARSTPVHLDGAATWEETLRGLSLGVGSMPLEGPALVIRGQDGYHLEEDGYGDFAWDLVRTDSLGRRFSGTGAQNEDYLVWGQEVRLPSAGVVVEVVRDAPDNRPGAYPEGAVNNMVGVWLGGQVYLYLLHFQQGSIPSGIAPGVGLEAGTVLGRVGNSGVSLEPHLHMTALYYDVAPVGSGEVRTWSVPIEWRGLWIAGAADEAGSWTEWAVPETGVWIDDEEIVAE